MGSDTIGDKAKGKGKLLGRDVLWIKPALLKKEYTMLVDGEPTAYLYFNNWYSKSVTVSGMGQYWTLDRKGLFKREVLIDDVDRDEQAAPFQYRWNGGGVLTLADGAVLTMRHGIWGKNSYWETDDKEAVITFVRRSWWRFETAVEFGPLAGQYPELLTLVFLGFYLRLLHEADQNGRRTV